MKIDSHSHAVAIVFVAAVMTGDHKLTSPSAWVLLLLVAPKCPPAAIEFEKVCNDLEKSLPLWLDKFVIVTEGPQSRYELRLFIIS